MKVLFIIRWVTMLEGQDMKSTKYVVMLLL